MDRYPEAVWRPLPEADRQPRITPVLGILHTTAGGPVSPFGHFARADVGAESHLWVALDGTLEQYVDLSRSADANYRANRWQQHGRWVGAVSVETADRGAATVEDTPWTPEQVEALARIVAWCSRHLGIPIRLCAGPFSPGWGWHSMFPEWSNVRGKTCPGAARIAQVPDVLALAGRILQPPAWPPPPGVQPPNPQEDTDMPRARIIRHPGGEIALPVPELGVRRHLTSTRAAVDAVLANIADPWPDPPCDAEGNIVEAARVPGGRGWAWNDVDPALFEALPRA